MRGLDRRAAAEVVAQTLAKTVALHDAMRRADPDRLLDAASTAIAAFEEGGKLLLFGNGGSAADAQHVAAELVWRLERARVGLAAVALVADGSVLTSIANDAAYDRVFARQIEALGRPRDVAFGISTSGRSANVVRALESARSRGLRTIALTGRDGGVVGAAAEIHVNVPDESTARVQEVHRTLLHIFCDLVERAFAEE